MNDCCEFGRLEITVDGKRFSARGAFDIKSTLFEREAGANMDSTLWSTAKPVPAEASGSLDYCNSKDFDKLLDSCKLTVSFSIGNPSNPIVYIFSNARISGRPSLNTETGEVSDITFVSGSVRKI